MVVFLEEVLHLCYSVITKELLILMAVLLRMSPAIPSSIPAWLGAREGAGILPGITFTAQKVETSMNVRQRDAQNLGLGVNSFQVIRL